METWQNLMKMSSWKDQFKALCFVILAPLFFFWLESGQSWTAVVVFFGMFYLPIMLFLAVKWAWTTHRRIKEMEVELRQRTSERRAIEDVTNLLISSPRMGAEKDEPEGARYIRISHTSAIELVDALRAARQRAKDEKEP